MYQELFKHLSNDTLDKVYLALQQDIDNNRVLQDRISPQSIATYYELKKEIEWMKSTQESIEHILFVRSRDAALNHPAVKRAHEIADNSWWYLMSYDEMSRAFNRGDISQDEYELFVALWTISPKRISTQYWEVFAAIDRIVENNGYEQLAQYSALAVLGDGPIAN